MAKELCVVRIHVNTYSLHVGWGAWKFHPPYYHSELFNARNIDLVVVHYNYNYRYHIIIITIIIIIIILITRTLWKHHRISRGSFLIYYTYSFVSRRSLSVASVIIKLYRYKRRSLILFSSCMKTRSYLDHHTYIYSDKMMLTYYIVQRSIGG